jgi:ATP-dependent RNA helicase RhlE
MTQDVQATELATRVSFNDLALAPFLQETIRTMGYEHPTPIQADAIPVILEGRDVVGLAQTGTGKTAAFVLPLLQRLSGNKDKGIKALILAPTRELAEQINEVIINFSGRTGLKSVTVYGGVSHRNQISQLRSNARIVVACPGRLMDHIRGKTIDLSSVEYVVFDEADRMLDMGFMPDVKAIVAQLPKTRQTMLFSATMPDEIADLAASVLSEPITVKVKAEQPVALVAHSMYTVDQDAKGDTLSSWLQANSDALTVVFTKMKHTAKRLGEKLSKNGIPSTSLHGNLSQAQRQRALQGFRNGKFRALIATDIASRGIDVEGVTHVLNYDMPDTIEAYIHRTGRAGRASREGHAVSFVTRADRGMIRSIEQWLKKPITRLNADSTQSEQTSGDAREEGEGRKNFRRGSKQQGGRTRSPRGERRGAGRDGRERRDAQDSRQERPSNERGSRPARGFANRDRVRPERDFGRSERTETRGEQSADKPRGFAPRGERRGFERNRRDTRGGSERRQGAGFGRQRSERRSEEGAERGARFERAGENRDTFQPRTRAGGFERGQRDGQRDGQRHQQRRGGSFRGQRDIDQRADYVYQDRPNHFIDKRSDSDSRPSAAKGGRKPFRGSRSSSNSGPRQFRGSR